MNFRANIHKADRRQYARAADILRKGGVVALPTETVYGLAADGRNDKAVARIYALKGRPSHNPLIAHLLRPEDAHEFVYVSPLAQALIKAFWPGPLTLVLPRLIPEQRNTPLSDVAGGWLPTLALRCADAPWREALLQSGWSAPLFMPSANISGHVSPTTAQHVADDFGDAVELIIDGGPCANGIESTVVKAEGNQLIILRPGVITADDLAPFCREVSCEHENSQPSAPGMLESHYAPAAQMRLNAKSAKSHEIFLGFGAFDDGAALTLSATGDLAEAARNLYGMLRQIDRQALEAVGIDTIAVAPIPQSGLGAAINDRLMRAAAPQKPEEDLL
jgi:L-threonylcarbamoyladenylate synthase